MQAWFTDAKLGIFIHWGVYAVNGISESWSFFNRQIGHSNYLSQLEGFTASRWNPESWAELFKDAGARYAVLTAKHHDGVALWDTEQSTPSLSRKAENIFGNEVGHAGDEVPLSIPKRSPAGRDLLRPFLEALRKCGLQTGIYYSHLDWSHADYASVTTKESSPNPFAYSLTADEKAWTRFLRFHRAQLEELCTQYGPIDLLWFDGDWERDAEQWMMSELRTQLKTWQPTIILNSRMQGYGDYATPEQGLPIHRPDGPWEFCMTINDSWGFQGRDTNYKSPNQVLRTFCECIGMGGNLLLDVGPREDGTIPEEQETVLRSLGRWIRRHEASVYGTIAGLPLGHYFGSSTLSKDRRTMFLHVIGNPVGEVSVRGLKSQVKSVTALGSGTSLEFRRLGGADWMTVPGVLWIDLPESALEPDVTVIRVELESELELYAGQGQGVTANE